ncbi:MAG: hypothetical protein AAB972_02430 [Patescibacteria group bacterium]
MKFESFEKKLYIPRDVEGKPNKEALEEIRELEKQFAKSPMFVGIAPTGSMVEGYSTVSSDIDIHILFDATPDNEDKVYNELREIALESQRVRKQEGKRDLGDIYENINPETTWREFKNGDSAPLVAILSELTRIVIGDKIDRYRQIYKEELHKIPIRKRKQVLDGVANFLAQSEEPSSIKRITRIISDKSKTEIFYKRRDLWKRRIDALWFVK